MQKTEFVFSFTDYSPLLPAPKNEAEKERAKKLVNDLKRLLGEYKLEPGKDPKKKPKMTGELLEEFCTAVQAEMERHRDKGSVVDITAFLPSVKTREPQPIELFKKDNGWWTQGYVGTIRLEINGKDVTIRVTSRFDNPGEPRFLRYVLEKALELKSRETKGVVYEDMTVEGALGAAFDFLLLHLFFRQLRNALKRGMYRQYQEFSHNDSNVRGRIDISQHIRENPFPNGKVSYVTREYTANNAINRLILKAAECLERKYRFDYRRLLNEDEQCAKGLAALKGELFDTAPVSAHQTVRNANKRIVHSVYKDYEPLRNTCIAILRRFGVDWYEAKRGETFGLLLDMPTLWEIFLHNSIFRKFAETKGAYSQEKKPILKGRRKVKPDFSPVAGKIVLDAKYKKVWEDIYKSEVKGEKNSWDDRTREDVLQIIAYMHIFRCGTGGVIFPVSNGKVNWKAADIREFELHKNLPEEKFLLIPYFIPDQADAPDFKNIMEQNSKRIREFFEKASTEPDPADE